MTQDAIEKTDNVYSALYTKINNDIAELFVNLSEVVAARGVSANLDTRLDGMQTEITALTSGTGVRVSSDDTTLGYLDGKLLAGTGITFAVGSPAGDETLTLNVTAQAASSETVAGVIETATNAEAIARTATDKALVPANVAEIFKVKDYIKIPIEYASDGVTITADEVDEFVSTNGKVWARTFDYAQTEDVVFSIEVPEDIVAASGIKFKVHCLVTSATGPSAEGVAFLLSGYSVGDGDSINGTFGTQVASTATGRTDVQYDRFTTSLSGAVTVTGLAGGEVMQLKLERDHDHASDTYGQLIGVTGVTLEIVRYLAP